MSLSCRLLGDEGVYERLVTGWVDAMPDGALRFTARLTDAAADLEVALTARSSPSFEILEASARARSEQTRQRCGEVLERLAGIAGRRMVSGFRREVAGLLGPGPGADRILDAAIEAARLSRQVARVAGVPAEPTAREFHQLDLAAWPELVDTCFTYRRESEPLLDQVIATPAVIDMYDPRPGARFVFHRYKRTEVRGAPSHLSMYQSMFDQVHGFEVWYEVDVRSHEVVRARALTPRLPYLGLCEQPQARIGDLVGRRLDGDWTGIVRSAVGGREGCWQLTDLTSDLFRLLSFEP
jgi:hypothetical protein